MKIRSAGGVPSRTIELLGGSPVAMPVPEIYLSLEKGVVDGVSMSMGAFRAMKLLDVLKYHTTISAQTVPIWVVMNLNKWNSLPKDVQDAIDKVSSSYWQIAAKAFDKENDAAIAEIKQRGQEIITPSEAEIARWRDVTKVQWDEWLAMTKSKGLPGQQIFDETLQLVKKYQK